jgi:hypothetical protein
LDLLIAAHKEALDQPLLEMLKGIEIARRSSSVNSDVDAIELDLLQCFALQDRPEFEVLH